MAYFNSSRDSAVAPHEAFPGWSSTQYPTTDAYGQLYQDDTYYSSPSIGTYSALPYPGTSPSSHSGRYSTSQTGYSQRDHIPRSVSSDQSPYRHDGTSRASAGAHTKPKPRAPPPEKSSKSKKSHSGSSRTLLTPPRTPDISRLSTPELAPLKTHGRFCACCPPGGPCWNDARYLNDRAKMDSQLQAAKAHISRKSTKKDRSDRLLDY